MTEEQRLKRIESMVEEIHALLIMGQVPTPGEAEYDRVIEELAKNNTKPLSAFLKRGGKIPLRHTAPGGTDVSVSSLAVPLPNRKSSGRKQQVS